MEDKPEVKVTKEVVSPKPLHPAVDFAAVGKVISPERLLSRLADELQVRGLKTAEDFKRPDVGQLIVSALQSAYKVDAATILNNVKEA